MATFCVFDTAAEAACRLAQALLKGLLMDFGFYLPTRGQTATPEALEALVTHGEALGFRSVMIADHVVFPTEVRSHYPYTVSGAFPGHGDALEQLTSLAFLAGMTERLRLVTSVMILPYRNPVLTAKMLATVDVLSRGRVTVGVGVGWLREEFEALHTPDFAQRGAVSNEYLQIFKRSSRRSGPRTRLTLSASSIGSPACAACRIRCKNPIHRSGSVATAVQLCGVWQGTAMVGIRSVPIRRCPCVRANYSRRSKTSGTSSKPKDATRRRWRSH
jgi:hypothetical protein